MNMEMQTSISIFLKEQRECVIVLARVRQRSLVEFRDFPVISILVETVRPAFVAKYRFLWRYGKHTYVNA